MSVRLVNFMLGMAALACGSNVVDAGKLPESGDGSGGSASSAVDGEGVAESGAPDAGNQVASSGCAIPDLGRYRLLFDSDGGRLERRIYTMRADGTELEALTPPGEIAREPALSPDGTRLAYSTLEGVRLLTLATGESELFAADRDQPAWSSDGLALYYRRCTFDSCVVEGLSVADKSLVNQYGGFPLSSSEFSADGSTIVYDYYTQLSASYVEVSFGIQAAKVVDPFRVWNPVLPSHLKASHPTISRDGVWLGAALQCPNEQLPSLWVSPLAVGTPPCEGRRITPAGQPSVTNPKWGPGVLIAYERGTPPRDIAIVAADSGAECIIQALGDDRNPSWVPLADFQSPQ